MAFDFTGKRVWVTGAGRGIGREVATQFVAAGASVVGLDLAFPEADYPYATRLLDIGDSKAVNACCAALLADGGLDVLVTHAPMHGYGDLADLPVVGLIRDIESAIGTEVRGYTLTIRYICPNCRAKNAQ